MSFSSKSWGMKESGYMISDSFDDWSWTTAAVRECLNQLELFSQRLPMEIFSFMDQKFVEEEVIKEEK